MDDQEEIDDEDGVNYKEPYDRVDDRVDPVENNPQDLLAAAGLEDSDAEDDAVISLPTHLFQCLSSIGYIASFYYEGVFAQ